MSLFCVLWYLRSLEPAGDPATMQRAQSLLHPLLQNRYLPPEPPQGTVTSSCPLSLGLHQSFLDLPQNTKENGAGPETQRGHTLSSP